MASTDAKSGFRLPWSTDRNDDQDTSAETPVVDPTQPQGADQTDATAPAESAEATAAETTDDVAATAEGAADATAASWDAPVSPAPSSPRKPNKFMADLTKAMQSAAEAARADALERLSAEAKAHIETIHTSTADEATELRKKADDDVSKIRDWSKAEVARIREETDERIAHRKEVLEREIEAHAAHIESRIERVQSRVTAFETEMAAFFERLLAEEDPTRFAAMAETMPEPPVLEEGATASWQPPESLEDSRVAVEEPAAATVDPWLTEPHPVAESVAEATRSVAEPAAEAFDEPVGDAVAEPSGWDQPAEASPVNEPTEATAEVPTADIWAAEPATEPVVDEASGEASDAPVDNGDLFGIAAEDAAETDPRLSALGIAQDFASAEAEAAAFTPEEQTEDPEIPTIAEDALAARLAGLVAEEPAQPSEVESTRVVVTGLVSVASIAGFKRNLARVSGVRTVGVSSGPDGEFVFAVTHDAGLDLTDGIATLPGFGARVTNEAPGELTVAARDPESEG
jgi:hypothetical protein